VHDLPPSFVANISISVPVWPFSFKGDSAIISGAMIFGRHQNCL
jgi:hypothetical protein